MPANKFSDSLKSIKRKPISAEILNMITDNILAGNLKPGDKLPTEFALAESLGVGRNSVREAIKMLHSLGLSRFPDRTPLSPRVVGKIERPAYTIEKLIYEVRPGFPVPAHLYLPSRLDHPAPAISIINICNH